MATIVLIHGITHQALPDGVIERAWVPAMADGVRALGHPDLADRLHPPRSRPDSIDVRAAYYDGVFHSRDSQGDGGDDPRDWTPAQSALADALALEWLEHVADRSPTDSPAAVQARRALDNIRDPVAAGAQGIGNIKREALAVFSRLPTFTRMGMHLAERYFLTSLSQVTRYLTDDAIRDRVQLPALDLITPETRVIIGHSLGSVVAYELAHTLTTPLPLLVTLGSPLGLKTIVLDRLRPPASFPPLVSTWLNLANREDVVAVDPDLRPLFAHDLPPTSTFSGHWFKEPGDPHRAETYLGRESVARAIITALD